MLITRRSRILPLMFEIFIRPKLLLFLALWGKTGIHKGKWAAIYCLVCVAKMNMKKNKTENPKVE